MFRKISLVLAVMGSVVLLQQSATAGTTQFGSNTQPLEVLSVTIQGASAWINFDTNHQCGHTRARLDTTRADYPFLLSLVLSAKANAASGERLAVDLRDSSEGGIGDCNGSLSIVNYLCMSTTALGGCFV